MGTEITVKAKKKNYTEIIDNIKKFKGWEVRVNFFNLIKIKVLPVINSTLEYVPRYSGLDAETAKPIDKTTTGRSPYARY